MNLKLPQLIALAIGGVLIYAAVKDVNAAAVIKAVLTGQPLPTSADKSTAVVDENGNPTGGSLDENGRYIPPTDSTTPQPQPADPNKRPHDTAYQTPIVTSYKTVSV